jgi:hypothetical protein
MELSFNEYKVLLKAFGIINQFTHQPLHFREGGIRRFHENYGKQLRDVSRFLDALIANEDRQGEASPLICISFDDLEAMRALIDVLLVICEKEDPELMLGYAQLIYRTHVHRIFYDVLGPIADDELAEDVASSNLRPIEFLRI